MNGFSFNFCGLSFVFSNERVHQGWVASAGVLPLDLAATPMRRTWTSSKRNKFQIRSLLLFALSVIHSRETCPMHPGRESDPSPLREHLLWKFFPQNFKPHTCKKKKERERARVSMIKNFMSSFYFHFFLFLFIESIFL